MDYQSKADIITQESREKKYNTWKQDATYAGDKSVYRTQKGKKVKVKMATKFIVLGTILHSDCLISRLLNDPQYSHLLTRAILIDEMEGINDVDELFSTGHWEKFKQIYFNDKLDDPVAHAKEYYYQHEDEMQYPVLWEDKYDCLDLAMDYYSDPIAFKQEMMNDAKNIGTKWFKSNRTQSIEEIENHTFTKTMLTIDPAGVKNKDKKRSDSFAFVVGSLSDNDFKYIRTGQLKKFDEFNQYIKHVLDLLKEFPEISHVYLEKNTYNGLDVDEIQKQIEKDNDLANRDITFISEMQRRNKDEKISTIVSDIDNGRIIFCEDRVEREAIQQLMDFSGQQFSVHDDFVDCLSEFANRIDQIEIIQPIKLFDRRSIGL